MQQAINLANVDQIKGRSMTPPGHSELTRQALLQGNLFWRPHLID